MGIKNLNTLLLEKCPNAMKTISLKELTDKTIVIDISIYIFKYALNNCLLENIYLMISIFLQNNINPIFVFDGKTPTEKKELVKLRREKRLDMIHEYNDLENKINDMMDEFDKKEILECMNLLKKKIINISKTDFDNIKQMITAFGLTYYEAPNEADEMCAYLCIKCDVYACLSEDMDMFVYGCPRILKSISLFNQTVMLYEQADILDKFQLTQPEFREICVLSGTDYNCSIEHDTAVQMPTLKKSIKLFDTYKKSEDVTSVGFYNWLMKYYNYISDYDLLIKVNTMFDVNNSHNIQSFQLLNTRQILTPIQPIGNVIQNPQLMSVLKLDGFIFPM
jgi:6-pyruvoyl-tetrahydropterin synthase